MEESGEYQTSKDNIVQIRSYREKKRERMNESRYIQIENGKSVPVTLLLEEKNLKHDLESEWVVKYKRKMVCLLFALYLFIL